MKEEIINNLLYADDTVVLASTQEGLQILLDNVVINCREAALELNIQKTKILVTSKQQNIKPIKSYNLGLSCILKLITRMNELRSRIEQARARAMRRLNKFQCNIDLKLSLRILLIRFFVVSALY